MKTCNRDLLVLVKDEHMNEQLMEHELEQLNEICFNLRPSKAFVLPMKYLTSTSTRSFIKGNPCKRLSDRRSYALSSLFATRIRQFLLFPAQESFSIASFNFRIISSMSSNRQVPTLKRYHGEFFDAPKAVKGTTASLASSKR